MDIGCFAELRRGVNMRRAAHTGMQGMKPPPFQKGKRRKAREVNACVFWNSAYNVGF